MTNMKMNIECYYISFTEYPYIPLGEKGIQDEAYHLLLPLNIKTEEDTRNLKRLKRVLNKGICPGKFDDSLTTCVIKFENKKYIIDKEGIVKCGSNAYYMKPRDFLWLFFFIEGKIEFIERDKTRKK
jgi:hypothetical protein